MMIILTEEANDNPRDLNISTRRTLWVQASENVKVRPVFESTAHGIVHQH